MEVYPHKIYSLNIILLIFFQYPFLIIFFYLSSWSKFQKGHYIIQTIAMV